MAGRFRAAIPQRRRNTGRYGSDSDIRSVPGEFPFRLVSGKPTGITLNFEKLTINTNVYLGLCSKVMTCVRDNFAGDGCECVLHRCAIIAGTGLMGKYALACLGLVTSLWG